MGPAGALDGFEDEVRAEPGNSPRRSIHVTSTGTGTCSYSSSGRDPVPLAQRAVAAAQPGPALGRRDVRPIFVRIIGQNFRSPIFRWLFAAQDLLDVEVLARIGSVRIN